MKLFEMLQLLGNDLQEFDLHGNADVDIQGLNLCNRESEKERVLSYATAGRYVENVNRATHVAALIVKPEDSDGYREIIEKRNGCLVVCENPEIFFYRMHEGLCTAGFYERYDFPAQIGENCNIHKTAVIEDGVVIGDNVTIGPNTVVRAGTIIDSRTIIGCNSTIGAEGFQLITNGENTPMHITHVGKCHICSDVYVGNNVCVSNSLFEGETYVGQGTKIDSLSSVSHNIHIGKNVVITGKVFLCGSVVVEEGAWIAPNASVLNRVTIGKFSKVGMGSVVTKDVAPYTVVYGNPARVHENQ